MPFMCGFVRDQSNSYAFCSISLLFGLFIVVSIFFIFHPFHSYIIWFLFFFFSRCGFELTGVMIVWCVDTAHKAWTLCISTANGFFSSSSSVIIIVIIFFLPFLWAPYRVSSIRYFQLNAVFSVFFLSPISLFNVPFIVMFIL